MWNTVKQLLASKKALATIVAILVWLVGKFGLEVESELLYGIVGPLLVYVTGQSIADFGKEKAKVDGETARYLATPESKEWASGDPS